MNFSTSSDQTPKNMLKRHSRADPVRLLSTDAETSQGNTVMEGESVHRKRKRGNDSTKAIEVHKKRKESIKRRRKGSGEK